MLLLNKPYIILIPLEKNDLQQLINYLKEKRIMSLQIPVERKGLILRKNHLTSVL